MITFHKKYWRKKKIKKILATSFLILIILGAVIYVVFFSPLLGVKEIEILGNEKVKEEDIRKIVEEKIFRKLVFLTFENIFLLDFKATEKEILENFPQVGKASFLRKLPSKIVLKIEERKRIGVFYQKETPFFIDREGIIFEEVDKEKDSGLLIKSERSDFNLGERVIEKESLEKILKIQRALKVLKIEIEDFFVPAEERVNVKTVEGWQIYFDLSEDLDWQITKLKLALEEKIPPEKRDELEYIDLRFGNMVYPKYRD